jgi:hypothetical protein
MNIVLVLIDNGELAPIIQYFGHAGGIIRRFVQAFLGGNLGLQGIQLFVLPLQMQDNRIAHHVLGHPHCGLLLFIGELPVNLIKHIFLFSKAVLKPVDHRDGDGVTPCSKRSEEVHR